MIKSNTENFIKKAIEKHGNKYDYSKVEYINNHTKICIICPKHGEFWQLPSNHLSGKGCIKCSYELRSKKNTYNIEEFIEKAKSVHGNKYDYSKIEYKYSDKKVTIICPKHGEFSQTPASHLSGCGCPFCSGNAKLTTKTFIEKANEIHGNKYDYSKVKYINSQTPVCIICPKHGEFWQIPNNHLQGKGCQKCNASKLEDRVRTFLTENGIAFNSQQRFKWLGRQSLDFYLPDYNIAIECQGEQHFKEFNMEAYIKKKNIYERIKLDITKNQLCHDNKIKLIYVMQKRWKNKALNKMFNNIYTDKNIIFDKEINRINEILLS